MGSRLAAAAAALVLAGCAGVSSVQVKALGPERDRPIAVAAPAPGAPREEQVVREGVSAGLARSGLTPSDPSTPGALILRSRLLSPDEEIAGGEGLRTAGSLLGQTAAGAVALFQAGSRAYNASRVRLMLVLEAPERREPVGALFWDGFAAIEDAAGASEEAGTEMAAEIQRQRERWYSRRIGDERLLLTSTPSLIPPGEWVLSNDELLLFHLGYGISDWLQLDVTAGALPIPVAGGVAVAGPGVAAAGVAGIGIVGTLALGLKVGLVDEGRILPGLAVSYDMVNVWGGALGGGGIILVGNGVAGAGAGAVGGMNLQFNLFTASASKHFFDWLQLGTGVHVLDNHAFVRQSKGFVVADTSGGTAVASTRITDRVPTTTVPWLSVEAAAGNHVRFLSEYHFAPGYDWFVLGMRTLAYRTRLGLARAGHLALKIDTALLFTRYDDYDTKRRRTGVFPWLGLAIYLR